MCVVCMYAGGWRGLYWSNGGRVGVVDCKCYQLPGRGRVCVGWVMLPASSFSSLLVFCLSNEKSPSDSNWDSRAGYLRHEIRVPSQTKVNEQIPDGAKSLVSF